MVIKRNATDQDSFVLSAAPNTFVFLSTPKTTGSPVTTYGVLPFVIDGASQNAKGGLRRVLLRAKAPISAAMPSIAAQPNSSFKPADITLHTVLTLPQLYADTLSANRNNPSDPVGSLLYCVLSQLIQYNTALIAGSAVAVPPAYENIEKSALLNGACGNLPILPDRTYGV